jgi:hypothetical protein
MTDEFQPDAKSVRKTKTEEKGIDISEKRQNEFQPVVFQQQASFDDIFKTPEFPTTTFDFDAPPTTDSTNMFSFNFNASKEDVMKETINDAPDTSNLDK